MPHFYEKNIVEIKNEYTTFLVNIITPLLYEGIKSIYNYALDAHQKMTAKEGSPGPLKIFQTCLKELPTLNQHQIDSEAARIKEYSRCSEWFDDLVKAVIKSNIVLLTFSCSKNESDIVKLKYHEQISSSDFIHKCYIESARAIYNNPELFWHEYPSIEVKRNQRETCEIIKCSIREAIRKMLPIKLILSEYLKNEYVPEEFVVGTKIPDSQIANIKAMVIKDIHEEFGLEPNYDGDNNILDNEPNNEFHEIKEAVQTNHINHTNLEHPKHMEHMEHLEHLEHLEHPKHHENQDDRKIVISDEKDEHITNANKQTFVTHETKPETKIYTNPNDIPPANKDSEIRNYLKGGNFMELGVKKNPKSGKFASKIIQEEIRNAHLDEKPELRKSSADKTQFFAQYF